jgi:uncharacterized protein YjbI with pentapeptide repeats
MPDSMEQRLFPHPVFDGQDLDLDGYRFEETDFAGAHAEGRTFLECTLLGCDLSDTALHASRWADCVWERVHGAGIAMPEASLHDVTIEGSRLAAVSAWGSSWRGVTVRGGKIDFLNLRGARLKDVAFEDCVVTELDLQEATVDGLSFAGCTLAEPEFGRGSYAALDLSGATLRSPRGVAGLKGATVSRLQLFDLAPHLAAELGITVADGVEGPG